MNSMSTVAMSFPDDLSITESMGARIAPWVRKLGPTKEAARELTEVARRMGDDRVVQPRTVTAWREGHCPGTAGIAILAQCFGAAFVDSIFSPYVTTADDDISRRFAHLHAGLADLEVRLNVLRTTQSSMDRDLALADQEERSQGERTETQRGNANIAGRTASVGIATKASIAINAVFVAVLVFQSFSAFDTDKDIDMRLRTRAEISRVHVKTRS